MVKDDDLNLSVKTRIVIGNTTCKSLGIRLLELSTTSELGDSRWDSAADTLESTDLIDSQEMKDLVPFSFCEIQDRSGLTYWQNSGLRGRRQWCIGTASFNAKVPNTTKSLSQTITPGRLCIPSRNCFRDLVRQSGQVGIDDLRIRGRHNGNTLY